MFTIKNKFGANITTDIGGEYVDASHADIIALAHEFDITFYDLRQDKLAPQTFFFGGKYYTAKDLLDAIVPFSNKIENDVVSLPESLNYKTASSFEHLDKLSITEYIKKMGISGWLYDFINVVLTREYGIEASEQSAINLLIMFSQPKAGNQGYELFGDDHEILKITGGSQRLTDALLNKVKDELQFNHALTAIEKTTGGYTLTFDVKGKPKKIFTNYVVLAIPFTILRNIAFKVDMPEEKRRCINEIGYGNSGKFILGVDSKPWRKAGSRGYTFTDLHVGCGWDSSLMQSENEGSFTVFGGGKFMDEICNAGNDAVLQYVVPQLNTVYPGFAKAFNNKTTKFCWSKNTFSKAGYSAFKKGQWSTLAGWEPVPVGNIYFAGEHVSPDFQGYMNGAAKTGREAAEMIAKVVGPMKSVRLGY
jgi:monoamine oxidase